MLTVYILRNQNKMQKDHRYNAATTSRHHDEVSLTLSFQSDWVIFILKKLKMKTQKELINMLYFTKAIKMHIDQNDIMLIYCFSLFQIRK